MSTDRPVILLASEHTEFDVGAERVAIALARRENTPLHVVRVVVTNPEFEVTAPGLVAKAEAEAAAAVSGLTRAVREAGVAPEIEVRRGDEPWREIVREASERSADLLVIRRRGKRAVLARMLVGDMVQKVISHSTCNALVVPRAVQLWQRRILAAIDRSPIAARVVSAAIREATRARLPLTIVTVCAADTDRGQGESAVADAVARARAAGVDAEGRVASGKVFSTILDAGREVGADLLVIGWNGEHPVRYAVLGGTAHKVVGLAECAVLVVKG